MTPEEWMNNNTGWCNTFNARMRPSQCKTNKAAGNMLCLKCTGGLEMGSRKEGTCKNCKRQTGVCNSVKYDGELCAACRAHLDSGKTGVPPRVALQMESNRQAAAAMAPAPASADPAQVREDDAPVVYPSAKKTNLELLIPVVAPSLNISRHIIEALKDAEISDSEVNEVLHLFLAGQLRRAA